jgi:2'-5' RNA ligase
MRTIGVAFPVPEPWAGTLARARASTGDPLAEFVPPHVTLVGPSSVESGLLPALEEHLAGVAAAAKPFTIHLRGTGTFRPVTDVVFISVVSGISECERLQSALLRGPLERDTRFPYHPHVTIAHDVPNPALDRVFSELSGFEAIFAVPEFTLYEHGEDGMWRPRRDFPLLGGESRDHSGSRLASS